MINISDIMLWYKIYSGTNIGNIYHFQKLKRKPLLETHVF